MKFYLSHSIRGKYGKDATPTQMAEQCAEAIKVGETIKMVFRKQDVEIYIPAEHEDFVNRAYATGMLTEQQILDIDCMIINDCDGVIIYCPPNDPIQGGRAVEYEHALATSKSVFIFQAPYEAINWIAGQLIRG